MTQLPKACVIGAGASGIVAAKTLHQRGFHFDVFEKSDRVGGNWVFRNPNGMSSAYSTLHINTSREKMEFADFPMPKSFPDFPHHTHIARYFDDYVDFFGFRHRIRFQTGVERCEHLDDGTWEVRTEAGEAHRYDALLVCNGHHWDPQWPDPPFPGSDTFEGEQMHSHHYLEPDRLKGRDVVVLGMGNSAMDIAVDSSYVANRTYLATRRGAHIIPKYLFGKPTDQVLKSDPRVPYAIRRRVAAAVLRVYQGQVERFGLPKPDHEFGSAHPTVSGRILDRLAHGAITPKPNIARLEGDRVHFTDGSSAHADLVVYCTGYRVTFPFFRPDLISAPDNDLPLFHRVFHPDIPSVFFIGLLQPWGAIMPLADAQARWVADYLAGAYRLPPRPEMEDVMRRERERMFKRYVASRRHTMQVDAEDYLAGVERERRRGAQRAAAAGQAPQVAARVERDRAAAGAAA